MFGIGGDDWLNAGVDLFQSERAIDRDADAADTAWRRGQENMGISNAFAAAEAERGRAFNERMAATSHQREVTDLRAAGLNPLLSLNKGAPASGGQASSAMANAPQQHSVTTGKGLNSAMAGARLNADLENIKADTILKTQQGYGTSAQAELARQNTQLSIEQQETQRGLTEQAKHQASILGNSAKGYELEGDIDSTTYGKIMRFINRSENATRMLNNLAPRRR